MRMPGSRAISSQVTVPEPDPLGARLTTSLRGFHVHSRDCHRCRDPYAVYKSPTRQLCDIGHQLAQEIALNLYDKAKDTPNRKIEVTFPEGWESVDGLILAITHKLQGEPTNCIDVRAHDSFRKATQYPPVPRSDEPLNRGSAYARDVSHRTGQTLHRHSSHREHSRRHSRSSDPRISSLSLIEHTHRSPSPTSSRSSSGTHSRRIEEAPAQQLSSSPRAGGHRVAFNPEVETRYF